MASRWHNAGGLTAALAALLAAGPALADQPEPWQVGFQEAASPIMQSITNFHNGLLVVISVITLFVMVLLAICIVKFNRRANPNPSRTTHHTLLEVAWTVLPVLILVGIAIPSFRLLYQQIVVPEPDLTIKATGYQWYWGYEYPDHEGVSFESFMLTEDQLQEGQPRLLAVDQEVVVPVDSVVKVLVTAADVIHSWTIPAFGSKVDAVPGRLNETWFRAEAEGTYYGQCSELCGRDHAFMPIAVRVVSQEDFEVWLSERQTAAAKPDGDGQVAQLSAGAEASGQ